MPLLYPLLIAYCLLLIALTWHSFRFAVGLFIISLPTYLIRFSVGALPTTLLEVSFGILFLVWLIKFARSDWPAIRYLISNNKVFFVFCFLFFLASIASIFVSDMWYASLGQWRAYFLEPMAVFVLLLGRTNSPLERRVGVCSTRVSQHLPTLLTRRDLSVSDLIWFLALSTFSISLFGIVQHFTGWHIGNVDWTALQTGRVTSFFLSPNAVGLYLGPIVPLIAYLLLWEHNRNKKIILGLIFTFSFITLLLSRSIGAWVGVGAGMLVFGWLLGYKKIVGGFTVLCLLFSLTPLAQQLLTAKNQSGANRLALWSYTGTYLVSSPKNFILGTGIRQFFRKVQKPFYNVKELERLIYPHNIFLNFWTETGLAGMLSFTLIAYCLALTAYKIYRHQNKILGAGLIAAFTAIIIHGLVDVPYFKNDLAMLWWILAALVLIARKEKTSPLGTDQIHP